MGCWAAPVCIPPCHHFPTCKLKSEPPDTATLEYTIFEAGYLSSESPRKEKDSIVPRHKCSQITQYNISLRINYEYGLPFELDSTVRARRRSSTQHLTKKTAALCATLEAQAQAPDVGDL